MVFTYYLRQGIEPLIKAWCEKMVTQSQCKIDQGEITWAGWRHPLSLEIKTLTLSKNDYEVKIEGIAISLRIWSLGQSPSDLLHFSCRSTSLWEKGLFAGAIKGPLILNKKKSTTFSIHSESLDCQFPGLFSQPLVLEKISGQLSFEDGQVTLQDLTFFNQGTVATLNAGIKEHDDQWQFKAQGEVKDLNLETLSTQWPEPLAPTPRTWVIENLPHGFISHADISVIGDVSHALEPHIQDIRGTMEAHDVEVHYLGELPPVIGAKGHVDYNMKNFIIDTQGTVAGVAINKAHLDIRGMDKKDQYMSIDMELAGPIGQALSIVDARPLGFVKKLTHRMASSMTFNPTTIQGQALTHLQLDFLLERDTPLATVQVEVHSDLSDIHFVMDEGKTDRPFIFDASTLSLDVNKKELKVSGEASINGLMGAFSWDEFFEDSQSDVSRRYRFLSLTPIYELQKWGIDLTPYATHDINLKILREEDREGYESSVIESDLKEAKVDLLGWHKDKGLPAHVKAHLSKDNPESPWKIETLILKGSDCDVSLKSNQGNRITISPSHMGTSHFQGQISWDKAGDLMVVLDAKVLDVSSLLDNFSQQGKNPWSWDLTVQTDTLICSPQVSLHEAKGKASFIHGRLDRTDLEAKLEGNDSMTLHVQPIEKNLKHLTFSTTDGGRFLKLWGTEYDLHKGVLNLEGNLTDTETSGWMLDGHFTIEDIQVHQAPLLSRLLAAASLQGMLELLTGQGITFTQSEGLFKVQSQVLTLEKVKFSNSALGLVLRGTIDYGIKQLDISGEIYPLYFINRLIAHIPLIGQSLSGGEDGVFATSFAMKGLLDTVQLTLNPLTTIAPGAIRKAFQ